MESLGNYQPRTGLSVPIVTILDRDGNIIEDEQRAVVRYALQECPDGRTLGADIVFAAGTNGEWNRIDNRRRQQVCRIALEECRASARRQVQLWAGITAPTRAETIKNLQYGIEIGADAAVVAPLSIEDVDDPVDFVVRDVGEVFNRCGSVIPIFLYDNADITAPGKPPHLRTRDVKRMAELDYLRGIKVTATKSVLGNYTRAAAHFKAKGEFTIYFGNAYLIFDLLAPPEGVARWAAHLWNRYVTRDSKPAGVVAGPANVLPREWRRAWEVAQHSDGTLMARYQRVLYALRDACEFERDGKRYRPTVACLKAALAERGVIGCDAVATGTPSLEAPERAEFARRIEQVFNLAAELLEAGCCSENPPSPPLVASLNG
jgi:dihydrodipicolinate synthase/N-acetylneuraminate lyase